MGSWPGGVGVIYPFGNKFWRKFERRQKSFLSIYSFFPILNTFETDKLSTLHVWLQRPRGIALYRAGFKSVVCQPAIERDA